MLKFIGSGSAFNTKLGNNSAYYKDGNEILLIDCGSNIFQRIKENNLLEGIEHIHVAITHTHADHVGSLADLILYTYYSHGEFAHKKVTVYTSDDIEIEELLKINGCIVGEHFNYEYVPEGMMHPLFDGYISFNLTKHVDEFETYGMEIEFNNTKIFYSSDSNELDTVVIEMMNEDALDIAYIDTCKADYEGNVHLSLRKLTELVPPELRYKVWCMHLDEGFDRIEAEALGFNVVVNEN